MRRKRSVATEDFLCFFAVIRFPHRALTHESQRIYHLATASAKARYFRAVSSFAFNGSCLRATKQKRANQRTAFYYSNHF